MANDQWADLKDVIVPIASAAVAAVLGFVSARFADKSRERSDSAKRAVDMETAHLGFDQVQMSTLTDRFKALLDGYERRITDLVIEVNELKLKHKDMQQQLSDQVSFCASCENYKRRIVRTTNAPNAAP